jgi:hypothetical protein
MSERCQCTHEQGDSDCAVHPTCSECGADISNTRLYAEHERFSKQLAMQASLMEATTRWRKYVPLCSDWSECGCEDCALAAAIDAAALAAKGKSDAE